ncbi:MMPL family transporter [Aureliella helgolandensis]|uniref:Membrane protein YdgH n=1 Tax=Aureliella helgolandensis TaxID=2527968 RepID=A0A518G8S3_9BACT|nr:MMPL family transporter [Aureliella helgolandensis]QDV24987.1 Putative membrane protein YdgH [Aureliella helgolandensis]
MVRAGWYKLFLSRLVTRHWAVVIGCWLAVAVLLQVVAPRWSDIAADGDLAFLPGSVPSAIGQAALEDAFPGSQARSQMIMVFANRSEPLANADVALALDITRRLHWIAAEAAWLTLQEHWADPAVSDAVSIESLGAELSAPNAPPAADLQVVALRDSVLIDIVRDNLTEAIEIEESLSRFWGKTKPDIPFKRLPNAYLLRGELLTRTGTEPELAQQDLDTASLMREQGTPVLDATLPNWASSARDVWSWRNAVVGHKLGANEKHARLVTIQLRTDFTATRNIEIIAGLEELVEALRDEYQGLLSPEFQVEVTGSAAIGADMLRASASGVRKTEIVTIVLVLIILSCVYRAPFLVAIPITSIALSLVVATGVIAILARDPTDSHSWGLGVFTTTRIFIVVLLFGAGTDFCLFFLARNRELMQGRAIATRRQLQRIVAKSWLSVHDALVASALTTIVGLALMWFSRFEKFQFSGPIIAISLAITLAVCLTFTPALLSGLGKVAFWPLLNASRQNGLAHAQRSNDAELQAVGAVSSHENCEVENSFSASARWPRNYWGWLADRVVTHPFVALILGFSLLAVPAVYGFAHLGHVTYDLAEELSESAASRRGAKLVSTFFPTQDGSPITILLTRPLPFGSEEEFRRACEELSISLYTQGVDSVRSLTDPLGDYPPGKRMGLFDKDAWRRRLLLGHRITKERYVSAVNALDLRVARFDIVLNDNPFSIDASATLKNLRHQLASESARVESPWHNASVTTSGTTVGITDLREITQADQRRIQILVTLGVWLVLLILLRQFVLSSYLIFTVLLSYFATLGVTFWVFSTTYGADYSGLDWKVPLFLFVILVAVGQDYNVYLVTRIIEERRTAGLIDGVRRALYLTGGIITSCGFVMAGTFIAMTSPAVFHWLAPFLPIGWVDSQAPVLRGITELGFALAFGVLLDTLLVRSILVPSFVVLWHARVKKAKPHQV